MQPHCCKLWSVSHKAHEALAGSERISVVSCPPPPPSNSLFSSPSEGRGRWSGCTLLRSGSGNADPQAQPDPGAGGAEGQPMGHLDRKGVTLALSGNGGKVAHEGRLSQDLGSE